MSVKKTPTGRWQVDAELSRGKRVRRTFDRKVDAIQFQAKVRSKSGSVSAQLTTERDKRRLSELVQLWFDMHGHTLRDGERRRRVLVRLSERLGDPVAYRLTAALYAQDRRLRAQAGVSDKTLNNELTYIRSVFNELKSLEQISYQNPLLSIKPVTIQEHELSWLTNEQIEELLQAVADRPAGSNPHLELLILVCLSTGARWSEAERLGPSSIKNGALVFSQTKSAKVRVVPIAKQLVYRLVDHWHVYGPFTSSIGAFRRVLVKTSIELPKGQSSHVLRHTFASHFMMNGGNILTLQRILGHSSVKVTMRYAHLAPEHLKEAVKYAPIRFGDTLVTPRAKSEGVDMKNAC
ncbi:tyrosine-type recombinase/integrase [Marinobacterium sp. D7]|uniref:phage integrase n=1 Tax=Marinobacterium ramblicola TaxID=2849041 RepID=UPI001C2D4F7D|nr:tyrosine-type recombinase/integrase [Marinobacterium ramblicola]MBV1789009.1 tyrosine-type recombinase/integrase [Marinobacterium ramblicola]